ncbi:MAG: T9SS type A sorting domain-containing protein [Candidatus Marinimicrobia bacterium]|nr:T9SS type A sorting domain-containing protein [Candidatus Neomarinimicrobiota bacterium]
MKCIYQICIILLIHNSIAVCAKPEIQSDDSRIYNHYQQLDANRIRNWMLNDGSIITYHVNGQSGLTWPENENNSIVYASGLWVAGKVNNEIRTSIVEYSSELQPGKINSGQPDDPSLDQYRIFLLNAGEFTSTDYIEWPISDGAPLDENGNPKIIGKQVAWWVANDANQATHSSVFGTQPLFIEEQVYTYCFDTLGIFQDMVVFEWTLINKGSAIDSTYIGYWSDPDLGNATDDFVGYDLDLEMGYAWNDGVDSDFGISTPSVGYVPLKTPVENESEIGITAFAKYINGGGVDWSDPESAWEAYYYLQGLNGIGNPYIDPTTGLVTPYIHSGDPVAGTGWIDPMTHSSGDRRFLMSMGPFTFAAGDTQTVSVAILIAQGRNYLNSITKLRAKAKNIKDILIDEIAADIIADDIIPLNELTSLNSLWVTLDNSTTVSSYYWSFDSLPVGSNSELTSSNLSSTEFVPDVEGTYIISLTLTATNGQSTTATSEVFALDNQAPTANFSMTQNTLVWGDLLTANATLSTDVDGDSLAYLWEAPGCILSSINSSEVSITPVSSGEKIITLYVFDEYFTSEISQSITIEPLVENIDVNYTILDTLWSQEWFFPFFNNDTLLVPISNSEIISVFNIGTYEINHIIDISLPNISNILALHNNNLYVTNYPSVQGNAGVGSLSIYALGDQWQLTPVLIDYRPGYYDISKIHFIDNYVLIRDYNSIYKTDFSNLSNPQVVTEVNYSTGRILSSVEVGQYIYIRYFEYGSNYVDVREKNSLNFVTTLNLPSLFRNISVHDELLFVGSNQVDSLWIYSITDPINPSLLTTISIPPPDFLPSYYNNGHSATYLNDSLLAIYVTDGIEIFDIQDANNPFYRGSWYNGDPRTYIKSNNSDYFLVNQPMTQFDNYSGITKISFDWLSIFSEDISPVPLNYALHPASPNPFNPTTTIRYDLPEDAYVSINVYDLLGRQIINLVNTDMTAGYRSALWNGTDRYGRPVSSGMYLYQIQAGEFVQTNQMILLK